MKYEFTGETKVESGVTLRRIRAVTAFGAIAAGAVGGWIEKEANLDRVSGDAWVYGNAQVSGDADLLLVGPIGSRRSYLTVTADAKIGVRYSTGCFSGDLKTLKTAVKRDHGKTSLYAKQYAAAIAMAKACVKAKGG